MYKRPTTKDSREDFSNKTKAILVDSLSLFIQEIDKTMADLGDIFPRGSVDEELGRFGIHDDDLRNDAFWTEVSIPLREILGYNDSFLPFFFEQTGALHRIISEIIYTLKGMKITLGDLQKTIKERKDLVGIGRGGIWLFNLVLVDYLQGGQESLEERQLRMKAMGKLLVYNNRIRS